MLKDSIVRAEYLIGNLSVGECRWRKVFCTLVKGVLLWYEDRDSVRVLGSQELGEANHCMLLINGSVGYKRTAELVREGEQQHLKHCFEMGFSVGGETTRK